MRRSHRRARNGGITGSSCNDISRTRRPASVERHKHDRLSTRSVHVRQALHAHRPRRLFLFDGLARRARPSLVRHPALCQLRPISGRYIPLAGAVRVSATRPVDIRLGQIQRRHLRSLPIQRSVKEIFFIIKSPVPVNDSASSLIEPLVSFPDTTVDELKDDVSQLKLPKSYTPRI